MGQCKEVNEEGEVKWVVTFLFKTAFMPVGMNVYCRNAEGISPQLTRICEQLLEMEDEGVRKEAGDMYPLMKDEGLAANINEHVGRASAEF